MRGNDKVIAQLNEALKEELTAINQYFLHAEMCHSWGYHRLGDYIKKQSIDEMKHADRLIERLLFLEGLPNLQDLGNLMIGENVQEILECDLRLEMAAMPDLRDSIAFAESAGDYVTRELFEDILTGEEEHVDFIETQLELIEKTGLANYIQSQTSE